MVRPKKLRFVNTSLTITGFIPENCPSTGTNCLPLEGLEALKLSDIEGLAQETAAAQMGVSRQTYGRVLTAARKVVAEALVHNLRIEIGGGSYTCQGHPGGQRRHRGGRG
ncbi:MAG: DUF134 domain-containing protein [Pseudomonadota bacterium]